MFTAHLYARVRLDAQFLAHETAGAARTRHSLLPLCLKGDNEFGKLGQNMPRDREAVFDAYPRATPSLVIPREVFGPC